VKLSGGIVKLSLERVKLRLWCGRGVAGVRFESDTVFDR
jgi:hypothetical protein